MKTVGISDKTHKNLITLKLEEGNKNIEDLIEKLILEYKKAKFSEASNLFNLKLKEKNVNFENFIKKSKKIKEEISDEWFGD